MTTKGKAKKTIVHKKSDTPHEESQIFSGASWNLDLLDIVKKSKVDSQKFFDNRFGLDIESEDTVPEKKGAHVLYDLN